MQITAVLTPAEEGGYIAFNPETGATTQGETVERGLANLREAVELLTRDNPIRSARPPLVTMIEIQEHA